MPTFSQMNIPTPKGWDDFEDITLDALKNRWKNTNLFRHGRQGQPQNGVDIYGKSDLFNLVGVQCKKYDLELTINQIMSEIEKADNFKPSIEYFYIATTLKRDSNLQAEVRLLSEERFSNNKFPVDILFWDDIVQDLALNLNTIRKHYSQLFTLYSETYSNLIGILQLSYFGKSINYYMHFIYENNINPYEMKYICDSLIIGINHIKNEFMRNMLSGYISNLKEYLFNSSLQYANIDVWKCADDTSLYIQNLISSIKPLLNGDELIVFNLGEILATWDKKLEKDLLINDESIEHFLSLLDKMKFDKNINSMIVNNISDKLNDLEILRSNLAIEIYYLLQDAMIMTI